MALFVVPESVMQSVQSRVGVGVGVGVAVAVAVAETEREPPEVFHG